MNSRKVKIALVTLIAGFVLLVSASYAWFTLSTKPEISGIQTNIGANGSLEIALLTPQTFMYPEEIKASIGSSMVNQEVTYSNLFWGNVIDLSDESYGLGQISLLPSRLDISEQTVVSGNLLKVPDYGLDGRFSYFDSHIVSASYDPPYFRYSSDVSFRGVRGIGSISRVTVQQAALNNARTSIHSYESAARRAMESVWRANGDPLFDILYRMHGQDAQSFTSADVAVVLDTCSRMLGVMDYLDAATRQGIVAVFAELVWDESQFLAIKSIVEDPSYSLTDLEDMLDDYSYTQYSFCQTLSQLIKYVPQDQKTLQNIMARCGELEGTDPTRNEMYDLLHSQALLSADYSFFNESTLHDIPSALGLDNTLTLYAYDMAASYGVMNHIAAYVGDYNVFFEYNDSVSIEVDGRKYNSDSYLSSLSTELTSLSGSGMVHEDTAVLDETYGYAIDLAVRCNIDSDLLLQTVAADRIDPDASSDPEDLLSQTQGGGSYMRFTGSVFKDQMIPLMDAIRIGFLDNRNNLIAVAKLNTSNYTEEDGQITAPLYLYDYSVAQDGSLSMGERRKDDNAILPLPEDSAVVMTVVVWLDGDHVPNSIVSTIGSSIDGTLNLQFASSAELNPAFRDDPDATQPDETKPAEPSDAYYLSTENGQYAFYTLNADGSREYTLPFSGTVDEANHTVTVESVSEHPDQGIWIPALATGAADSAAYSVSIDPSAPFETLSAENVHISFVPVAGSKVGVTGTSLQNLFNANDRSVYRTIDASGLDTSNVTDMGSMFYGCSSLTKLDLSSFDTGNVTDMSGMFQSCSGLTELNLSGFDTSNVTDMNYMFRGCSGLTELDVTNFNTAKVTDMSCMFSGCSKLTELDVSSFETSNVTNMMSMFFECSLLTELNVTGFNTENVESVSQMFGFCTSLTELDVTGFDTQKATSMLGMFWGCSSLTDLDVTGFDTSNAVDMSHMFHSCSSLTTLDLSSFDTSNVTNMDLIFFYCSDLQTIVTPKVIGNTAMELPGSYKCQTNDSIYIAIDSSVPTQATLQKLTVATAEDGNVYYLADETTDGTFVIYTLGEGNTRNYQLPVTATLNESDKTLTIAEVTEYPADGIVIPAIITDDTGTAYSVMLTGSPFYRLSARNASVTFVAVNDQFVGLQDTSTSALFSTYTPLYNYETFAYLDVSALDTSKVTNMSGTFGDCEELLSLNISQWDTSSVTDMSSMFSDCVKLTSIDVSNFDTKNVTNMYAMFFNCSSLTELDISNFDTSSVTNLRYVFRGCSGLTELDLSNFDTANVTSIAGLFEVCTGLTELDLSNFNTANVKDMSDVFSGCTNLQTINLTGWSYAKVTSTNGMFDNCPATIIK